MLVDDPSKIRITRALQATLFKLAPSINIQNIKPKSFLLSLAAVFKFEGQKGNKYGKYESCFPLSNPKS